jgi:hypothetical protein
MNEEFKHSQQSNKLKDAPRDMLGFTFWLLKKIFAQKKWALLPVWILLLAVAILILIAGHSTVIPAIYMAF